MGSQVDSTSTAFAASSSTKRQKTAVYAQLIGPSFIRLQSVGFAGISRNELDLRFINPRDNVSIRDAIRELITETKNQLGKKGSANEDSGKHNAQSKAKALRFTAREVIGKDGKVTNYGYGAGMYSVLSRLRCEVDVCFVQPVCVTVISSSNQPKLAFVCLSCSL
jgi:hypothetical protein